MCSEPRTNPLHLLRYYFAKASSYRDDDLRTECASTSMLLGSNVPLRRSHVLGVRASQCMHQGVLRARGKSHPTKRKQEPQDALTPAPCSTEEGCATSSLQSYLVGGSAFACRAEKGSEFLESINETRPAEGADFLCATSPREIRLAIAAQRYPPAPAPCLVLLQK